MYQTSGTVALHPNSWLKEMARLNPAKWNWSRSIRTSMAIALPMLMGYWSGTLAIMMWIAMGAMFPSIGERDAPYRFTIKKILISAPIGASGFLLGYLGVWGIDWAWIVLLMAALALGTAIASSYSATVSVGCLQFMVMAAVALGNPEIATFWKSSALLLCGAGFYLCLLWLEKWIWPHHIRQDAVVEVLQALDALCASKLADKDTEPARLNFNLKYEALYRMMLQNRYRALGHNPAIDQTAAIVQNLDNIFAALLAEKNKTEVHQLQVHLQSLRSALQGGKIWQFSDHEVTGLDAALNALALALWGKKTVPAQLADPPSKVLSLEVMLQKLTPGHSTLMSAAALALCTAIGYGIRWVDEVSHWYWVPMTVSIVMKPELGSIFVRAVQRTVGTAAGVLLGGMLLAFIPVGPLFILIIAGITFVLPWLAQRNYALTALAITPFVLVLIDLISPGHRGMEYAGLRLVDTLIGCGIVLLFGYLLWPRRHTSELGQSMMAARRSIAQYLEAVLAHRSQPNASALSAMRRNAYGKLVDMRAALQKSLAEPPPAGYEAAAWFPWVACAARLCDAITVYSVSKPSTVPDAAEWAWLEQAPQHIAGMQSLPPLPVQRERCAMSPDATLIACICKETHMREQLYERVGGAGSHAVA